MALSIQKPQPALQSTLDALPVRDVLVTLADELERARTLGLRVEGAICAIAVRAAIDGSVIAELQQLDAVLQHIAALRDFAGEVSRTCDSALLVDVTRALDRVTLAEVRTRLAGGGDDEDGERWEMF